MLKLEEKC